MSDKDRYYLHRSTSIFWMGIMVTTLGILTRNVKSQVFAMTQKAKIVHKVELLAGAHCTDSFGSIKNHMDEWSSGACDNFVCYMTVSGSYVVEEICTSDRTNVDFMNCDYVSKTARLFPDCCPELKCKNGTEIATVDPSNCYDRSTTYACEVWKNYTGCMTSTDPNIVRLYNFTVDFCRKTCGFC
ncbi:hypothetical protein CHS0354_015425 [Potamilus streckersoni]|uniref:ShKT domain-containing protein n=1 Tax=Potamilus streckersoni TaxID=2493646 RepID=A0AAE0VMD3_9BIVA|nr:hypothetical protein CHS0354_015425 [Potamilus streckersoni]